MDWVGKQVGIGEGLLHQYDNMDHVLSDDKLLQGGEGDGERTEDVS